MVAMARHCWHTTTAAVVVVANQLGAPVEAAQCQYDEFWNSSVANAMRRFDARRRVSGAQTTWRVVIDFCGAARLDDMVGAVLRRRLSLQTRHRDDTIVTTAGLGAPTTAASRTVLALRFRLADTRHSHRAHSPSPATMQVGITGGCESARVYRASAARKYGLIAALIAMYALVLPMCYNTAGEPRAAAFGNSFSKYGDKWETWEADEDAAMAEDSILSIWGMRAREDARQRRESPEQATYFAFSTRSRDDRLAAAAYREFRQFVFETFRVEGEPSLPPAYLPSALACLSLFCALTLHGA